MRSRWQVGFAVVVIMAAGIVLFQNCSVRRLNGAGGATGGSSTSVTGGTSTGTTTGGTTGGTTGTGTTTTAACLLNSGMTGSMTGITGQPAIRTGLGITTAISSSTYMILSFTSECYSRADIAKPAKCATVGASPTPTPACDTTKKSFTLSISLNCAGSATATTCSNFTVGTDLDLSVTAQAANVLSIGATNATSSCASTNYGMPFTGKTGHLKVTAMTTLATSQIFTVQLTGVKLYKDYTTTNDFITVDGTYPVEIVASPGCTP